MVYATPVALAVVYGVVVLAHLGSIVGGIYLASDAAIAPMLAHLAGASPAGASVVLGNHAWYEEYLFMRATASLPGYREIWELAPILWSLGGLAALGWAAWRAFGRFCAALVVSALLCTGSFGRFAFFTLDWHGLSVVHTAIVGAAVVWLAGRPYTLSWGRTLAASVGLGLIGVLPSASDRLFVFWALIPLLVTGLALEWQLPGSLGRRIAVFSALSAGVSLVGGALVAHTMQAAGVFATGYQVGLASPDVLATNARLALTSYLYIGGGDFLDASSGFWEVLSGVLMLGALALVAFSHARQRLVRSSAPTTAADPHARARFAYTTFWMTCLLSTTGIFVFSSAPQDVLSGRYLLAGYVAVGALLPAIAARGRRWRLAVAAAVSIFAVSAIHQTLDTLGASQLPAESALAQALSSYAHHEHAAYGYTGYWDAAALTWATDFKLPIYPVRTCTANAGLCPTTISNSSWYIPRPHTRSLLIVDSAQPPPTVTGTGPALGRPISAKQFGQFRVYVFPYDLATTMSTTKPQTGLPRTRSPH